jgi:hypothetical protein
MARVSPHFIAKGVPLFSAQGGFFALSSLALFLVPGYAIYRLNTSSFVRGDLEAQLPRRPDLPMGGNVGQNQSSSGRVFKAEANLNDMLKRVQRVTVLSTPARSYSLLFVVCVTNTPPPVPAPRDTTERAPYCSGHRGSVSSWKLRTM